METVRVYKENDQKYFSITTILGAMKPFDNRVWYGICRRNGWDPEQISQVSQKLGTRYHAYFENRRYFPLEDREFLGRKFKGTRFDFVASEQDLSYLEMVNQFFDDGWEILESEVNVINADLLYAGRLDAIARNESKGIERCLLDIKSWGAWKLPITGKVVDKYVPSADKMEKLEIQLNMYRRALGERIPMYGVILTPVGLRVEDIAENESWIDALADARQALLEDIEHGKVSVEVLKLGEEKEDE